MYMSFRIDYESLVNSEHIPIIYYELVFLINCKKSYLVIEHHQSTLNNLGASAHLLHNLHHIV